MRPHTKPPRPEASLSLSRLGLRPRSPSIFTRHRIPARFGHQPHILSPFIYNIGNSQKNKYLNHKACNVFQKHVFQELNTSILYVLKNLENHYIEIVLFHIILGLQIIQPQPSINCSITNNYTPNQLVAYYVSLCHFEQEAMLGVTFVEVGLSSDPILCQYSSRTVAHKVCPQGINCSKPF